MAQRTPIASIFSFERFCARIWIMLTKLAAENALNIFRKSKIIGIEILSFPRECENIWATDLILNILQKFCCRNSRINLYLKFTFLVNCLLRFPFLKDEAGKSQFNQAHGSLEDHLITENNKQASFMSTGRHQCEKASSQFGLHASVRRVLLPLTWPCAVPRVSYVVPRAIVEHTDSSIVVPASLQIESARCS